MKPASVTLSRRIRGRSVAGVLSALLALGCGAQSTPDGAVAPDAPGDDATMSASDVEARDVRDEGPALDATSDADALAPVDATTPPDTVTPADATARDAADVFAADVFAADVFAADVFAADVFAADAPRADASPLDVATRDAGAMDAALSDVAAADGARTDVPGDRAADAGCATGRTRDLWAVTATPIVNTAARDALFAFAASHMVRAVYINPAATLDSTSGQDQLAAFVRAATARCLGVELLYGHSAWSPTDTTTIVTRARLAVAFLGRYPDVRIEGLHFDIEPHGGTWYGMDRNTVANLYLDTLTTLYGVTRAAGLRSTADIPHWYWTIAVTRAGRTAPLDEWLTPQVDRFVIMDYYGVADAAATQARIVSQAQHEGATAAALGREWILGLNVAPGSAVDETLADEGSAAFAAAERAALTAYTGTTGFRGTAVYDYDGFVVLGP